MKHLFLIMLSLLSTMAMAQQRSYGMSTLTPSEKKASIIILKVSETIPLSEDQVLQLTTVTSDYWEDLQELQGQKKYEEKFARLIARRDKKILDILKDELLYTEYQKKFEAVLAVQRIGYGRR